jgi:hypothetical protein
MRRLKNPPDVMAGLDPAIQGRKALRALQQWMAGSVAGHDM